MNGGRRSTAFSALVGWRWAYPCERSCRAGQSPFDVDNTIVGCAASKGDWPALQDRLPVNWQDPSFPDEEDWTTGRPSKSCAFDHDRDCRPQGPHGPARKCRVGSSDVDLRTATRTRRRGSQECDRHLWAADRYGPATRRLFLRPEATDATQQPDLDRVIRRRGLLRHRMHDDQEPYARPSGLDGRCLALPPLARTPRRMGAGQAIGRGRPVSRRRREPPRGLVRRGGAAERRGPLLRGERGQHHLAAVGPGPLPRAHGGLGDDLRLSRLRA